MALGWAAVTEATSLHRIIVVLDEVDGTLLDGDINAEAARAFAATKLEIRKASFESIADLLDFLCSDISHGQLLLFTYAYSIAFGSWRVNRFVAEKPQQNQ